MELKGTFVPLFQVPLPGIKPVVKMVKHKPLTNFPRASSSFGETFPMFYQRWKPIEVHCSNGSQNIQQPSVSKGDRPRLPELSFDRQQLSDEELCGVQKRGFGRFVARGAVLDEEYWTAAWLRAEAHWESLSYMRHVESYKRKYAEQEFYALKRRCTGRDGNSLKCFCLVTVKKEDKNVRRTVLNSVVGTLDLSVRLFLRGETYPGELKRSSTAQPCHVVYDGQIYAYIANVCVSKFARRKGVASNMLCLATDIATTAGMKQLFVHVNADNRAAQELYRKTGFEMVEGASCPLSKDQRLLMSMQL